MVLVFFFFKDPDLDVAKVKAQSQRQSKLLPRPQLRYLRHLSCPRAQASKTKGLLDPLLEKNSPPLLYVPLCQDA